MSTIVEGINPRYPDIRTELFTTVGAVTQAITFNISDGPIVVGGTFLLRLEWSAIGSGGSSESAGVAYAAYFDNASAISLIGSSQPLSSGVASISFGTTGARNALINCIGSAGQTLTWVVRITVNLQA